MNLFCPGSQSCFVIISGHDGLGDSTPEQIVRDMLQILG